MTLTQEQIKEIIPHRDPFLFLDEIVELEPGKRCVAKKTLTGEEFWWKGHFPEYPVMPGVLIMEALAQAGAVSCLILEQYRGKIAFYAGMDDVKFRRQVKIGDTLRLECELVKMRGKIGVATGTAYVGDEKAASGTIKFAIGD
ncbi:MAG: 3-hydroxyacyl-ACP dehydratase FabZ [Eubacteriales bacterium]|jgi:3-hydroxyacyl-[acyl-carrier-protein] dehydratase